MKLTGVFVPEMSHVAVSQSLSHLGRELLVKEHVNVPPIDGVQSVLRKDGHSLTERCSHTLQVLKKHFKN